MELESGKEVIFIHLACMPSPPKFKAVVTFAAQQQLYNHPELLLGSKGAGSSSQS